MPHERARGQKQQGLADATRLAAALQKKEVNREKKGKLEHGKNHDNDRVTRLPGTVCGRIERMDLDSCHSSLAAGG